MFLQTLIDCLAYKSNVHICIQDISGLQTNQNFKISYKNKNHTSELCNCAKNTINGMRLCFTCKILAQKKAFETKDLFIGRCPLGLTEIVQPVLINGVVVAIIYIGNIVEDLDYCKKCIKRASKLIKVDESDLLKCADTFCFDNDKEHFINIAKLIDNYMKLLYETSKISISTHTHWAVEALLNYGTLFYNKKITLSQVAKIYHLNENYLGRIFKQHVGTSFNNYINSNRIEEACKMLEKTDCSIINISYNTGFNNVTHFNKVFKKFMKEAPIDYRNNIHSTKENSDT